MYVCKRCHYQTHTKCNLVHHLSRQHPCCSIYSDIDRDLLLSEMKCVKSLDFKDKRIAELEAKVRQLEEENKKLVDEKKLYSVNGDGNVVGNSTTVNNNTTINNTHNTTINQTIIQIPLNNFGQECLDHITDEFKDGCLLKLEDGLVKLVHKIHFDADMPENRNIQAASEKRKTMRVFIDGNWVETTNQHVLEKLFMKSSEIFGTTLRESGQDILSPDEYDQYLAWIGTLKMKMGDYKTPMWKHNLCNRIKLMIKKETKEKSSKATDYIM